MSNPSDPRCEGCPLDKLGTGFVKPDGDGRLGILVVGEAPDKDEIKERKSLSSGVGRTWNRIVRRTYSPSLKRNLERDDFVQTSLINCRPPDDILAKTPYEIGALDACKAYLRETIRDFVSKTGSPPKAILTLGELPFQSFTGHAGITKLRGYIYDYFCVLNPGDATSNIPLIPTYAPKYVQGGKWHLARVVESDILKAVDVARGGRNVFDVDKKYLTRPTIEEAYNFFESWVVAGRPPLAFDIETPWGSDRKDEEMTFEEDSSYTILMVSFAYEGYKAISMPWMPPFIDVAKALLGQATTSLVWNAPFDVPRLAANGVEFGGQVIDVMLMWHWLEPSLPMGLKFVAPFLCPDMDAWALGKDNDFALYNCGDSDVLLRCYQKINTQLAEQGRLDIFQRHFLELGELLSKMTKRGIKVDREIRTKSRLGFEAELRDTIEKVQEIAPKAVCPVHPKKGYKKDQIALQKIGSWVEGGMRKVRVEITEEEAAKLQEKERKAKERNAIKAAKTLKKKNKQLGLF